MSKLVGRGRALQAATSYNNNNDSAASTSLNLQRENQTRQGPALPSSAPAAIYLSSPATFSPRPPRPPFPRPLTGRPRETSGALTSVQSTPDRPQPHETLSRPQQSHTASAASAMFRMLCTRTENSPCASLLLPLSAPPCLAFPRLERAASSRETAAACVSADEVVAHLPRPAAARPPPPPPPIAVRVSSRPQHGRVRGPPHHPPAAALRHKTVFPLSPGAPHHDRHIRCHETVPVAIAHMSHSIARH